MELDGPNHYSKVDLSKITVYDWVGTKNTSAGLD